ncbi:MAG: hypothetical protein V4547_14930 [Bacteroidota bacterium]
MKKAILIFSICLTFGFALKAQAPQGFNYQAVARNNSGVAVINQSIGLKINLRQGTATGTITYSETHTVTSSNIGLLNLIVGGGTVVSGTFNTIDWSAGPYFIEISMDITGGTNYVLMGTQQLMSVPYALYAANGGTTGAQGITGSTGATGLTGDQGAIGVTGAVGSTGITGTTGIVGSTGASGTNGIDGIDGSTGALGITGSTGGTGIAGPTGDRYATTSSTSLNISVPTTPLTFTVETGLAYSIGQEVIIAFSSTQQMVGTITSYTSGTGVMDVTITTSIGSGSGLLPWSINLNGAPGPAGPVGVTGNNGNNGSTGATGLAGSNGTNGSTGATGTNGIDGSTGSTGTNGINGSTGATGTNGINGATGSTGATGSNGTNGSAGSNGTNGSTGPTGADATFAVQFNVVNSGASSYLFDNASDYNSGSNANPAIKLYRGFTYKFNVTASGHPFIIATGTTGNTPYTVGVTNNGDDVGVITFKVPQDAPATLHYICGNHSGMTGTITIL